jgi:hypothetical protein
VFMADAKGAVPAEETLEKMKTHLNEAASFAELLGRAHARKEHDVALRMLDKVRCRELLVELGAPVVDRFDLIGSMDKLHPAALRTPTVLKPRRGSNNRGVFALIPIERGRWWELLSGSELDFATLRGRMASAILLDSLPDFWLAEDLVEGASPKVPVDDVKLNMFGSLFSCSFVRSNAPRGYRWFDDNWDPVDVGVHAAHLEPRLPVPAQAVKLEAIARSISVQLPLPFLRVDLLVGSAGAFVGELTPYPGWYRDFSPEWDRVLGGHYRLAAETLGRAAGTVAYATKPQGATS